MSTVSITSGSQLAGIINGKTTPNQSIYRAQREADFKQAAKSLGIDSDKADALLRQIDAAIEAAKNGTPAPGKRNTVSAAFDAVLKQNGIDVKEFHRALEKAHKANSSNGTKSSLGSGTTVVAPARVGQPIAAPAELSVAAGELNVLA